MASTLTVWRTPVWAHSRKAACWCGWWRMPRLTAAKQWTSFRQALGFMERGLKLHDTMIYAKKTIGNITPNRYHQSFEYMFVLSSGET